MTDKNYQASVQLILLAAAAGTPHNEIVLSLGATPQYLQDHGFSALDLKIKAGTIDKAHFEHGITKSMLDRLGDIVQNPKALYKSATIADAAVVITFEQKDGSPVLVPIHANRQVGREQVNLVTSVYNKEPAIEARWAANGLLLWKK